jgi:hypothetical protein
METIEQPKFKNTAETWVKRSDSSYGFRETPNLLFIWSGLLQKVVSQSGTFLMQGRFHQRQAAIYKTEGGCVIDGVGELVLSESSCYFDHGSHDTGKLANLITEIVLAWNPNEPVDSMLEAAGKYLSENCPTQWTRVEYVDGKREKKIHRRPKWSAQQFTGELKNAIENNPSDRSGSNPFGGNALSSFFPFSKAPIDRKYERYCLVRFNEMTDAEVDQKYADQDQGELYLKQINDVIRNVGREGFPCYSSALCCRPDRRSGSLQFWINTGGSSVIDGWKTADEIESFIKG